MSFSASRIGLYIHIPFCRYLCHYCDFHKTKPLSWLTEAFMKKVLTELKEIVQQLDSLLIESVYWGGGTPLVLPLFFFEEVQEIISPQLVERAEITLETTPDELSKEKVKQLQKIGVNRISVGVASLQPSLLQSLGRGHSAEDARQAIALLKEGGWNNISCDLLYGMPGQSLDDWQSDLEEVIQWNIPHLSLYGLQIEEKTQFGRLSKRGEIQEVSQDKHAEFYLTACKKLKAAKYKHYEVSSFAREGYACCYNLNIWRRGEFAAAGPAAWWCHTHSRSLIYSTLFDYIYPRMSRKQSLLEKRDKRKEFWMLGLRLREGVNLNLYREKFGEDTYLKKWRESSDQWQKLGLVRQTETRASLTDKGFLVQNELLAELFTEKDDL